MDKIFLEVLRLSVLSGAMTLAVLIIRLLPGRMPKSLHCLLWMLVGIRLLIPFSIESVFGLFPEQRVLEERIFYEAIEKVGEGTAGTSQLISEDGGQERPLSLLYQDEAPGRQEAVSGKEGLQWILRTGSWIWCVGMLFMMAYFLYSWFKIKNCVRDSEPSTYPIEAYSTANREVRIFLCNGIETPFLFGILHPEIYVPFHIDEEDLPYIVRHELAHKRRRDHLVKPAAFFLLAVHWFNPCIWLAYKMLCRDMELACDEMVIRDMKVKDRKAYSRALLNCSVWKEKVAACPVAFGELSVKERIKNILNYKKPTVVAACFGVILCAVLLFGFMTQKKAGNGKSILLINKAGNAEENAQELKEAEKAEIAGLGTDEREEINELQTAQERELEQIADQAKSLAYVKEWADAFCDRDGKTIVSLCSDEVLEAFREEEIIFYVEGEEPGFGWSSPWPWDSGTDYRIVDMTDTTARVLYYAWTSDPHVTVWEENLTWHMEGERYLMDRSELTFRDNLCTGEEFYSAYPEGIISGTRMDYLSNEAGEALNNNAKVGKDIYESYELLFSPDTAARFLLNLLNNDEKVKISVEEEGERALVSIEFILDHTQVQVTMIQPYGADGIWIPQTREG